MLGCVKMSATCPLSTMLPASITATSLADRLTTDISWVIRMIGHTELAVDVRQQIEDRAGGLRVERRRRLVAEQQNGLGASPARAQCRYAASGRRTVPRDSGHPCRRYRRDREFGDPRAMSAFDPGDLERQLDVGRGRSRRQQVEVLEDHADAEARRCAARGGQRRMSRPSTVTLPESGRSSRVDGADERALARAALADDAEDLTPGHGQRHVVKRTDGRCPGAVALGHPVYGNHGAPWWLNVVTGIPAGDARRRVYGDRPHTSQTFCQEGVEAA